MSDEINTVKNEGWDSLLEEYNKLFSLFSSWKTEQKKLANYVEDEAELLAEIEDEVEGNIYPWFTGSSDLIFIDNEGSESNDNDEADYEYKIADGNKYDDHISFQFAQKYLEDLINKIGLVIKLRNSQDIGPLFEKAGRYCRLFDISYSPENDLINDAISLTNVKVERLLYTPSKNLNIVPQLIIPTQEYLISLLKKDPRLIFGITPRQFEELIAELFRSFGFNIELTQATRDGGRDIIAINEIQKIKTKYLIECKRYEPSHKISISIVRNLWAVKMHELANKAILVTTSSYTKDANMFASNHVWDLDLKAYDDIMYWIKHYKNPALPYPIVKK
jgi:hypothetical protein